MDQHRLIELLQAVREGSLSPENAARRLGTFPYEDLDFAKLDHHRAVRKGFPEVVFGDGKTPEQVSRIVESLAHDGATALVTRAEAHISTAVLAKFPEAEYNPLARTIVVNGREDGLKEGVVVVSAGTADMPVAEEVAVTARTLGSQVEQINDVGVAGLHRLLDHLDQLRKAHVIVAVAGMDGALPAVVAGLVEAPVIAAPTSVGYGTGLGGAAALTTMLNACAPGVAVVNIDNGFGAGYLAGVINQMWHEGRGQ